MKHTFHVNGDVKKQYCCFYVTKTLMHSTSCRLIFQSSHLCCVVDPSSETFLLKIEVAEWVTVTAGCYERKAIRVFCT